MLIGILAIGTQANGDEPALFEQPIDCSQMVDCLQDKTTEKAESSETAKADAADEAKQSPKKAKESSNANRKKRSMEALRKAIPQDGKGFINDQAIQMLAEAQVNRMIKAGKATKLKQLQEQLQRGSCELKLLPESTTPVNAESLYKDHRKSVVVIMISRKHNDHWHVVMAATGFMITADGTMVTNQHVIESTGTKADEYMFAMTMNGRVYPIKSVLASNEPNDAAICQVDGSGFRPLALRTDTPVGSPIRVISHPKGRLYTLSEGLVSRRYAKSVAKRKNDDDETAELDLNKATKWVTVTADFGKGSSGAPVFDAFGNAIGIAARTSNVTIEKNDDAISQMVFRDCVPVEVVLEMINQVE